MAWILQPLAISVLVFITVAQGVATIDDAKSRLDTLQETAEALVERQQQNAEDGAPTDDDGQTDFCGVSIVAQVECQACGIFTQDNDVVDACCSDIDVLTMCHTRLIKLYLEAAGGDDVDELESVMINGIDDMQNTKRSASTKRSPEKRYGNLLGNMFDHPNDKRYSNMLGGNMFDRPQKRYGNLLGNMFGRPQKRFGNLMGNMFDRPHDKRYGSLLGSDANNLFGSSRNRDKRYGNLLGNLFGRYNSKSSSKKHSGNRQHENNSIRV